MLEPICRALCQVHGPPTDTRFQGKPIWETYRREARAAIDASGIEELLDSARYISKTQSTPADVRNELAAALKNVEGERRRAGVPPNRTDEGKSCA